MSRRGESASPLKDSYPYLYLGNVSRIELACNANREASRETLAGSAIVPVRDVTSVELIFRVPQVCEWIEDVSRSSSRFFVES